MCGIIGYVGSKEAGLILFQGLKRLEYRGYDSAGVATTGSGVELKKDVGKIDELNARLGFESMPGKTGIGHTRWATHGEVTKENAHPHTCCKGEVAVVHNGIIENFSELREELRARGHELSSETDTEVVAHLVEENLGKGLEEAVRKTALKLNGSFALLVVSGNEPGKIVAARKESPLIVGLAEHGFFAASDAMPLLEHTKRVAYLEDGEYAVLEKTGVRFFELKEKRELEKPVKTIEWEAQEAEKQGAQHFMFKEITEQPQAMRRALMQDKKKLQEFADDLKRARKVMMIACGTARHAAVIGKHLFDRVAKKDAEVMIASEFSYFAEYLEKDAILLCVSQSGETADVMDGVRKFKARGGRVYSIVNVVGSSLDRVSDKSVYINCGPEIGVAATKSFLNQMTVFYLLAHAMEGKLDYALTELKKISELIEETIQANDEKARELSEWLARKKHAYFIGRGVNFSVALEGALKLKEISYVHAEGMPAGELKHGTIALIEEDRPVFLLNPTDYTYNDTLNNGIETKARGARLVGVSNKPNQAYTDFIQLPELEEEIFYPLLQVVPLQLVAYYTAVARGCDPDKPRNLAKSVTVK